MVRTKPDPRKVEGSVVHTKCTNILSTNKECHRVFGKGFKNKFVDGVVKGVRVTKTEAGRNQTMIKVCFTVAGVFETTLELSLAKLSAGPAPGPRPPSPDVQIVTPARVATFNYGDGSEGLLQANLHHSGRQGQSGDIPFPLPPGFLASQRMGLDAFRAKKQKLDNSNRKKKKTKKSKEDKASIGRGGDENVADAFGDFPSFSSVGFTQVPGFDADNDNDSMIASMGGEDDDADQSDVDRNMQSTIDDLHRQSTEMASILKRMRSSSPNEDDSKPAAKPTAKPSPSTPPPKESATKVGLSETPIVVASPVAAVARAPEASGDSDRAVYRHESSQSQSSNSESTDSELDHDIRDEVRRSFGRPTVTMVDRTNIVVAAEQRRANDRTKKYTSTDEQKTPKLGPLQLPAKYNADGVRWVAYMPTSNINSFAATHRWHMRTSSPGLQCYQNCDEGSPQSCLSYFQLAFPMRHLNIIIELTNRELAANAQPLTTREEILKFLGIVLLMPRLPDMPRREMWREGPKTMYGVAADLNRTRMSRNRFEKLLSCIR